MWNWAACSAPICSQAGSTPTGRVRPLEVADEYHDQRATPKQDRLCACASVDVAQVCHHQESTPGQVKSTDTGPGGFQDPGSGSLDGAGGHGVCAGSLAIGDVLDSPATTKTCSIRQSKLMAPRSADGRWIPQMNPKLNGGQGGREYSTEVNS
jgi:hypothetical protein